MGHFLGFFKGAEIFLTLEMPHDIFCPRKKIISRTFRISGTLIAKITHPAERNYNAGSVVEQDEVELIEELLKGQ